MTKSPTISAKVPFYEKDNKWNVELYDTNGQMIFPCDNEDLTPAHFVPKLSNVACVLQCGGIWIGGKGWGVTWKLVQAVVKPKEVVSVFGKCHINLSEDDKEAINEDADTPVAVTAPISTMVEDSDNEEEPPSPVVTQAPTPVVAPTPVADPVEKKVVKKIIKKSA
jgi:hypothetical protein